MGQKRASRVYSLPQKSHGLSDFESYPVSPPYAHPKDCRWSESDLLANGSNIPQTWSVFHKTVISFQGAKLYSEVFSRYIKVLIEEGYPIEFFIEGGRSRNGKLVLPKTGFLSILLQAYEEGHCNDLIFIPASIVYDRIMEERSYIQEIEGAEKKKETFFEMLKARSLLKRKYGKAYIRFSKPLSLREYLSTNKDNRAKEVSRDLAYHFVKAINDVTPVTPLNLTATAILSNHRKGFYQSWVTNTVKILKDFLSHKNTPFTESFRDINEAVEETMSLLMEWKVVERFDQEDADEEPFFFVEDNKKLELDYYKNSIIHYFVPHSLLALSLLRSKDQAHAFDSLLKNYQFLKDLFRYEFIFDKDKNLSDELKELLRFFIESGLIIEDNNKYSLTKSGAENLPIWSRILKNYLESYWIVAHVLSSKRKIEKKKILQKIRNTAKKYYKLGIIDHIEGISHLNFQNALNALNGDILKTTKEEQNHKTSEDSILYISKILYEFINPGHHEPSPPPS